MSQNENAGNVSQKEIEEEIKTAWQNLPIPSSELETTQSISALLKSQLSGMRFDSVNPTKSELWGEDWLDELPPSVAAYYCASVIIHVLESINFEKPNEIIWDYPDISLLSFLSRAWQHSGFFLALNAACGSALEKFIKFLLPNINADNSVNRLLEGLQKTLQCLKEGLSKPQLDLPS